MVDPKYIRTTKSGLSNTFRFLVQCSYWLAMYFSIAPDWLQSIFRYLQNSELFRFPKRVPRLLHLGEEGVCFSGKTLELEKLCRVAGYGDEWV